MRGEKRGREREEGRDYGKKKEKEKRKLVLRLQKGENQEKKREILSSFSLIQ